MVAELASSIAGMALGIQKSRLIDADSAYGLSYRKVGHVDAAFLGALEIEDHVLAGPLLRFPYSRVAQMLSHVVLVTGPAFEFPMSVFFFAPMGRLQDGFTS